MKKTIAILTAGGDCPGINAVIRAVAKTAMNDHGMNVIGIDDGFLGLIEGRWHPLGYEDVSGIITQGGTIQYVPDYRPGTQRVSYATYY